MGQPFRTGRGVSLTSWYDDRLPSFTAAPRCADRPHGGRAGFLAREPVRQPSHQTWADAPGSARSDWGARADERADDVGAGDPADQLAEPNHREHPPRQPDEQPGDLLDLLTFVAVTGSRVMTSATTCRSASVRYAPRPGAEAHAGSCRVPTRNRSRSPSLTTPVSCPVGRLPSLPSPLSTTAAAGRPGRCARGLTAPSAGRCRPRSPSASLRSRQAWVVSIVSRDEGERPGPQVPRDLDRRPERLAVNRSRAPHRRDGGRSRRSAQPQSRHLVPAGAHVSARACGRGDLELNSPTGK